MSSLILTPQGSHCKQQKAEKCSTCGLFSFFFSSLYFNYALLILLLLLRVYDIIKIRFRSTQTEPTKKKREVNTQIQHIT